MVRSLVSLSALAIAIAGTPVAASAQTQSGDVAGSYAYLHDSELNLPTGWVFAATGSLTPKIGIVGEVGGNYGSLDVLNVRTHSFLGGVKFCAPNTSAVTPFAQLLGGTTLLGASTEAGSDSRFVYSVQPGGGVDVALTPNARIRLQGDYRYNRRDGVGFNQFRFATGIVYAFGGSRGKQQRAK
jgi:hypothetical protein